MDKYEYNLKFDQIKSLCSEENYDAAAEIADTINWSKIRNVNALVKAGEVYEKVSRYDEAHSILLMAYDRSPIGRMIIYRLAELAIKMNDLAEAQDYYQEFVEIAPRDNLKFVLQYEILKAKGASYPELIAVLEKLKEQEYTEEWSYELAYLYHKANMVEKCIEACDELILWFGDGPYVERALELKMLYQPLSKSQEEKYRSFRMAKEGITRIHAEEMEKAGEYGHQPVNIPQVTLSAERFNTVNLQEEIAKGMQQIMNATEKTTVTDTIDSIRKAAGEIPYLQLPKESAEPAETETHIETDEEIDGSLKINFQELLDEDADGQVSMVMDEQQQLERQITGQMTIADVLEEWEKTKHAAEMAMKEAEQRKLESAKARALQEAGDIMERLTGLIPKLDAGVQPVELLEEEYMSHVPTEEAEQPEETTPIETVSMETAPIETAPIEAAPIETAPIETSSIDVSPIEQVENAEISEPVESVQADEEQSEHSINLAGLMMAGTAAAAKLAVGGIHEVEAAETAKASAIAETAKAVASGLHELHPTE
ncbi:MAG: tetratricopeptide repeat protein, partial [Agathobacter sp.]|uniref:tetratricopeptide repeat protein n=1 Tax=Agathobacter sp. TaxID=2021311 RepID=UPI002ED42489|nr:tetratricopeptide repeat protein [Agathobacter sp.]